MNRKTKRRNKAVAMLLALVMGGSMAAPFVASTLAEALPAGEAVQMDSEVEDAQQVSAPDNTPAEAEKAAMPEEEPATPPESAAAVLADDEETDDPDIQPEDIPAAAIDDEPESTQEPVAEPSAEPTQEPTAEPSAGPTQEPTVEPTQEPTAEPTAEPTQEPTTEPTTAPTTEPTQEPTPIIPVGSYAISITPPEKWQTGKATATVKITDQNGTGWVHIKIVLAAPSAWTTVADGDSQEKEYAVTLRENSTLYVSITDHAGNVQSKSEAITCFDDKAPTVRAGISGEMICIEASDEISGMEAVFINGHRLVYKGDALDAKIEDYANGKEKIAVQAVDRAGNFSGTVYVKNPFYGQQEATPRPTKKPSSSGGSTSGGSGGTGTRATPRPAATATPVPTATPIPAVTATPYPQQLPMVTAVPSVTVPAIDAGMVADIAEKVLEGMIAAPSSGSAFVLNGNMKTLDLLYSKAANKQFISVQTKQGHTYYIVIDYDKPVDAEGDLYETYFLNLVDDADLLSVLGNQPTPEPTATPVPTLAPTPTPTPTPTAAPEPEKKDSAPAMMVMLLLTVLIGGGAAALVLLKKKDKPGRVPDIDDLDFDDDDEDDDEDKDAP